MKKWGLITILNDINNTLLGVQEHNLKPVQIVKFSELDKIIYNVPPGAPYLYHVIVEGSEDDFDAYVASDGGERIF